MFLMSQFWGRSGYLGLLGLYRHCRAWGSWWGLCLHLCFSWEEFWVWHYSSFWYLPFLVWAYFLDYYTTDVLMMKMDFNFAITINSVIYKTPTPVHLDLIVESCMMTSIQFLKVPLKLRHVHWMIRLFHHKLNSWDSSILDSLTLIISAML